MFVIWGDVVVILVIVCGVYHSCRPTFLVIMVRLVESQRCNHHAKHLWGDCIRSDDPRQLFDSLVDRGGVWSTVGVVALEGCRVRTRIKSYYERKLL